jgi:hypothetical protein
VRWQSAPVTDYDQPEAFRFSVKNVGTLRLRVICPASNNCAWAVWFEPQLSAGAKPQQAKVRRR